MENNEYKIREVAGSPVITVPRQLLRQLELEIGDKVTYRAAKYIAGAFVVKAVKQPRKRGKK